MKTAEDALLSAIDDIIEKHELSWEEMCRDYGDGITEDGCNQDAYLEEKGIDIGDIDSAAIHDRLYYFYLCGEAKEFISRYASVEDKAMLKKLLEGE